MIKDESNKRCMLRADPAAANGTGHRAPVTTKERCTEEHYAEERRVFSDDCRAEENCAAERRAFSDECRVANMQREYPGYEGDIRWIIFTDLSEEELTERYGEEISSYQPFILLTMEMYKPVRDYHNVDRKYKWRMAEFGSGYGYEDGESEAHHPGTADEWEVEEPDRKEEYAWLYAAIDQLPEKQRRHIIRHYFEQASMTEIAREEGVNQSSVSRSIKKSLGILKEIL